MPTLTKLLPLLAGAFFCFGYPSFITEKGFPLFPIISIAIFFSTIHFENKKKDLINIFLYGASINILCFYWIPQTITTFGQLPIFISYILFILFSFIVVPFTWISYFALSNLKNLDFVEKLQKKPETLIFLIAFVLTVIEYYTPSQFPVRLGQSWMNTPEVLGLAPLFGLPIYSFLTYQIGLTLLQFFKTKKILKVNLVISLLILIAGITTRSANFQEKSLGSQNPNFHVRMVQANIGNYMKIQSELGQFNSLQEVYNRFFTHSVARSDKNLDLIIWPETSFPEDLNTEQLENYPSAIPPLFKNIIAEKKTEILFGGYDRGNLQKSKNGLHTVYNSAFHFGKDGNYRDVYHKHQLIPFGETLPLGPITPYLKDYVPGVSFFSRDDIHTVFSTDKGFNFIVPICYELLSPHHISDALTEGTNNQKQPHFIINLTNDSWYGITAEPYQHLFLAKWRAVEFQTPVLRSTNSGITSVFDIDGEESQRLLLGEVKHLDLALYLPTRKATLYQEIGLFGFVLFSLVMGLLLWFIEIKSARKQ